MCGVRTVKAPACHAQHTADGFVVNLHREGMVLHRRVVVSVLHTHGTPLESTAWTRRGRRRNRLRVL